MNKSQSQSRFQSNLKAISSVKSPDLDTIPGHGCRKRKPGESPFFSKSMKGYNCLDFGPEGTQTLKSYLNSGKTDEIKSLKDRFLNRNKISSNPGIKGSIVEKFEVSVKNGAITAIRRIVDKNGNRITAKSGGKYIPKNQLPGYSLKIMELDGKPDGVYEV